jgi:SAM-dependent methyltransferase
MPINLLFFPAAYLLLDAALPPWVFPGLLCALWLANGAAGLQRVPLFLSSERAGALVRGLLPAHGGFRFIDLGCGTGSLLTQLARERPDGCYTGIELAPLPFGVSRWRASRQPAVDVRWGDFWREDLAGYDVVYAYLSPAPMQRLWEKARREMRPGSVLVSNGFHIPGAPPPQVFDVGDAVRSTLYLWRM